MTSPASRNSSASSRSDNRHAPVRVRTRCALIGIHGYFDDLQRELLVAAGLLLLIWRPAIRCPVRLAAAAGVVAEASLFTYLTHYQVYALLHGHPAVGLVASIAVGILITQLVNVARTRLREHRGSRSEKAIQIPAGGPVRH